MRVRVSVLMGVMAAVLGTTGWLLAGVFSGKVASVSPARGTLVLKSSSGQEQTYTVPPRATVTVDGKAAKLDAVKAGAQVSVFTDSSDKVTKLIVRSETSKPAAPAKPEADDPPAVAKTKSKSAGSGRKRGESEEGGTIGEWPQLLGPHRDNVSRETGLLRSWPQGGPKLLWTARGLGAGYSSVSVANGMVYTMGNRGPNEAILAMRLENGNGVWEARNGDAQRLDAGEGPRGTPTVDGELVFGLGGGGDLSCVDARSGAVKWQKNILREFGGSNITWGISESVLIDGERLICTPGGRDATVVALNKNNGQVIWRALVPGGVQAGYASVVPIEVGGVRQYVQFTARGTVGIRAEDGKVMWGDTRSANGTANCSSPVFWNDMVFTASGYGTGGAMLRLASRGGETTMQFGYHTQDMKNHHGGMVVADGFVYGSNDPGVLMCIELRSGQTRWQNRSVGKGAVTAADGMLILRSEQGPVALVELSPSGYKELGRFDQPNRSGSSAWPYPVVADGKLFLRDQDALLCFDLKNR